jgi:uncharacterized protein YjiS (DUF1127 family)
MIFRITQRRVPEEIMSNSDVTMRHQDRPIAGNHPASGLWRALLRLARAAGVQAWNAWSSAREQRAIAEMSDHLLRDIGLARTDMRGTVRRVRL